MVVWNRSRVFLQIRLSELNFIKVTNGKKKWCYKVEPMQSGRKLIIKFKEINR